MTEDLSAWAATRNDSVRVQASESGVPLSVRIDPDELRYGGEELASTILSLCVRATETARARRRDILERDGMDADVLDLLGLPRASTVADSENDVMDTEAAPVSWMKTV